MKTRHKNPVSESEERGRGPSGGRHSDAGERRGTLLLRGHRASSFVGEGNAVNVETRRNGVATLGAVERLVSCYMNFASKRETGAL